MTTTSGNVTATAREQAGQVAGEAKQQARSLLDQTRSQAREQAGTQKQQATKGLRQAADELRGMTSSADPTTQRGVMTDLASQAADALENVANWVEKREPGDLIEEVRQYARRRPGMFLAVAAAAGLAAGRLTRGAIDSARDSSDSPAWAPSDTDVDLRDPTPATSTAPIAFPTSSATPSAPITTDPVGSDPFDAGARGGGELR